jgi:hypothetical protein
MRCAAMSEQVRLSCVRLHSDQRYSLVSPVGGWLVSPQFLMKQSNWPLVASLFARRSHTSGT